MLVLPFVALALVPSFYANGYEITVTYSEPTSLPDKQGVATGGKQPNRTLLCSARGTPALTNVTSIRMTVFNTSGSGTTVEEEELGKISADADSDDDDVHPSVVGKCGSLSAEDPERSFLRLDLGLDTCDQDGVVYKCYFRYLDEEGREITSSTNYSYSAPPGRMIIKVKPKPKDKTFPMASVVKLTCKGSAGSEPRNVGIVWQWAAVDSGPFAKPSATGLQFTDFVPTVWDKVLNATITSEASSLDKDTTCRTTTIRSTLIRTLTETDRYRTYRCYPVVNQQRHLVHLAASYRIRTELPSLKLTTIPKRFDFAGDKTTLFGQSLRVHCREQDRPMEPVIHVRIQLFHEGNVLATAEDGLDTEPYNESHAMTRGDHNDISVSNINDDRRPNMYFNTDVRSDQLLYLCLTTNIVDCHSGGLYDCLFSYTMSIAGARPVTVTQKVQVFVPVEVAPQRPTMTADVEQPQYLVYSTVKVTCAAFVGGPQLHAYWMWQTCRHGNCSAVAKLDCVSVECLHQPVDNRTVAEYHGDICQYKQSSSVLYTFQDTDIDEVEIRCYVIINASSHSSTARNFYVIASRSYIQARGGRMGKHVVEKYTNTLLSTAIPVMMSLGVLIFLLGVLVIAWGRFYRIQRRLSCSVYRRGRASRTEHFRRKRRSDGARGKEEDAPCRPEGMDFIKIYFRTALAVFIDRTEMETEEIEKKLFSQRQGQIRRRRRISSTRRRRSSHRRRRFSCDSRRSTSDNSWQAMAMARLGRKLRPRRSASAPCGSTGRGRHRDNAYSGALTEAKLGHNASGVLATTGHTTTPSYH